MKFLFADPDINSGQYLRNSRESKTGTLKTKTQYGHQQEGDEAAADLPFETSNEPGAKEKCNAEENAGRNLVLWRTSRGVIERGGHR